MHLLYLENSDWEFDYLKNEILNNIKNLEIKFFNRVNLKKMLEINDLTLNNILVINIIFSIDEIIDIVKYIKPIAIFYFSDEHGHNPRMVELENYTKLVFRQYNFNYYNYSINKNYQIPLGYAKSFLNKNNLSNVQIKKMSDRNVNASFIGSMKSDRIHMYNIFKNMEKTNIIFVENHWNLVNLPYSPEECFHIYNDSKFVICGRGNTNLDCFRIYEAIVAGSIPIIVGQESETDITFKYNNNKLPTIYTDTWENAFFKCSNLINNHDELEKIQNNLLNWWNDVHNNIKNLIENSIVSN
jgi:hypothetical protein